jgi:hypothetical protein
MAEKPFSGEMVSESVLAGKKIKIAFFWRKKKSK